MTDAALVACVDFGSTFTKAALVDVDDRRAASRTAEPPHHDRHRRPRRLGRLPGRSWPTVDPRAADGRGARLLVGRRRAADRRRRQRGAGHRRGRPPGRAVQRRPRRARRQRRPDARTCVELLRPARPTWCCWSAAPTAATPRCCSACAAALGRGRLARAGRGRRQRRRAGRGRRRCSTAPARRTSWPTTWSRSIGVLAPGSARAAIREMFLRHVIGGKHLSKRADFTAMVRGATPDVVLTAVELLARGLDARAPGRRGRGRGRRRRRDHRRPLGRRAVDPEDAGLAREVVATVAGQPHRRGRPRHALERRTRPSRRASRPGWSTDADRLRHAAARTAGRPGVPARHDEAARTTTS